MKMLRQLNNIRIVGIILGFPTLISIGIFLYNQQIEVHSQKNTLLKERIETLVQQNKNNIEIMVQTHKLKLDGMQQQIDTLQLMKYKNALSELEAQDVLFNREKTNIRQEYLYKKRELQGKIKELESLVSYYEEQELIRKQNNNLFKTFSNKNHITPCTYSLG